MLYVHAGERYVTFDGIAKACAMAMGKPEPELIHFNPKDFDFSKKKPFPMRDGHFFASIDKAVLELGWEPEFGLVDGLKDSYEKVQSFSLHCASCDVPRRGICWDASRLGMVVCVAVLQWCGPQHCPMYAACSRCLALHNVLTYHMCELDQDSAHAGLWSRKLS